MAWTAIATYLCFVNDGGQTSTAKHSICFVNDSLFAVRSLTDAGVAELYVINPVTGVATAGNPHYDYGTDYGALTMGRGTIAAPIWQANSTVNYAGTNSTMADMLLLSFGENPVPENNFAGVVTVLTPTLYGWKTNTDGGEGDDGYIIDNGDAFGNAGDPAPGDPVVGIVQNGTSLHTIVDTGTASILKFSGHVPYLGTTDNMTHSTNVAFTGYSGSMSGLEVLAGMDLTCNLAVAGQLLTLGTDGTATAITVTNASPASASAFEPFQSITYLEDAKTEFRYYALTKSNDTGNDHLWLLSLTPPAITNLTLTATDGETIAIACDAVDGANAYKHFVVGVSEDWEDSGFIGVNLEGLNGRSFTFIMRAYDAAGNVLAQGTAAWAAGHGANWTEEYLLALGVL